MTKEKDGYGIDEQPVALLRSFIAGISDEIFW
jgi:hypothetical protein